MFRLFSKERTERHKPVAAFDPTRGHRDVGEMAVAASQADWETMVGFYRDQTPSARHVLLKGLAWSIEPGALKCDYPQSVDCQVIMSALHYTWGWRYRGHADVDTLENSALEAWRHHLDQSFDHAISALALDADDPTPLGYFAATAGFLGAREDLDWADGFILGSPLPDYTAFRFLIQGRAACGAGRSDLDRIAAHAENRGPLYPELFSIPIRAIIERWKCTVDAGGHDDSCRAADDAFEHELVQAELARINARFWAGMKRSKALRQDVWTCRMCHDDFGFALAASGQEYEARRHIEAIGRLPGLTPWAYRFGNDPMKGFIALREELGLDPTP